MTTTELLTASDVSARLGVDRSTVYRMAADGRLGAVKVGTQWRFPPAVVDEVLRHGGVESGSSAASGDVPLRRAREVVLRTAAPLLGVMMTVTDMQGRLLTDVMNPCMWFTANEREPAVLEACTVQWRQMAGDVELTPRLEVGSHGFECARSFIRDGNELVGLVVAGGISPDAVDRAAAVDAGLYFLDARRRARLLSELPRVAAAMSDLTTARPLTDPRSAR